MPQRELAGTLIDVNEEGYFTDHEQWNRDLAVLLALEHGISLTDKHFEVIHLLREKYAEGTPLSIRRIGKSGVVSIKEFYGLFPGGPLKVSSHIAGIPKPTSCV